MNAILEKGKYHKYLIHALAAGALTLSFATVSHVNNFMHSHLHPVPVKSKTLGKSKSKDETGVTDDTSSNPPEPSEIGPTIDEPSTPPTVAAAPEQPVQAKAVTKKPLIIPQAHSSDDSSMLAKSSDSILPSQKLTSVTIDKTKIDVNFIRQVEGSVLKGYVPLATTTKSGVTVGDGVDLGQLSQSEFNKLPITESLKQKLQPYIGLKQLKAKAFLKAHPLTITNDEMTQLNAIVANKILQPLAAMYQKASGKSFTSLPGAAQTALFSYAYQHGPGFMYKASAKKLWNYFVTENWAKASATLRSSKMYASRRKQEANLLDKLA